ncbi:HlyD family efflux transporter periplasmic adaptor subunit [Stenotrophomonas sp. TWI1183]|uniref:HlyD family secretion protein n=1 Tax=Stenotrophomonas sp. TWI1183 TaxID=3136799 RepID=UPI00320970FA
MSEGLFRNEVLEARRDEKLGKVSLRAPRFGWVFFGIGIASALSIFCLLVVGRYTRHERVQGMLVPANGLIVASPMGSGVVSKVLVQEGETVALGQPLVEITLAQDSVALGETQTLVAAQLRAKQTRLRSDLVLHRDLGTMQRDEMHDRLINLRAQAVEKSRQASLQKQRADSANDLYEEWLRVQEAGIVSRYQLLQQRDAALQHRANQIDLETQLRQLEQQISEATSAMSQLEPNLKSRENQTSRQLADVEQSLVENAALAAVVLRAKVAGTVTNVLIKPGQAVSAGQTVLSVVPEKSPLLAELWVPSSAIGFVDVGKPVTIRYEAYPFQKFGQQRGQVMSVSRSATPPDAQALLLGTSVTAPRYRVEVALLSQRISVYGKEEKLRPGMALDADISLESRRLIEWIFDPLYSLSVNRRAVEVATMDSR